MAEKPRTIEELKDWCRSRGVDSRKFALADESEPDEGCYYILKVPKYWTINIVRYPDPFGVVVRCDTEAEVCECFVELVDGTDREESSLLRRLQKEMRARIENSWQF